MEFLLGGDVEQRRLGKEFSEQAHGLCVVISVGNALVEREAQVERGLDRNGTIRAVERLHVLFADHDEDGVGAPVCEVVIARVELDGAEVRDEDRAVVGVFIREILGHVAVLVQRAKECHDELAHPHGRLGERIEDIGRAVRLVALADGKHEIADLVVDHIDGRFFAGGIVFEDHHGLVRVVRKSFFHDEGERDVVAVIVTVADDEAVHPRAHLDGARECREDHVKEGEFIFRALRVFLLQICFHGAHIHELLQKSLVIRAVRHHDRHKDMHGVEIAYESCVAAVAAAAFCNVFHF